MTRAERELDASLRRALGAPDASQLVVLQAADAESLLQASEQLAGPLQQAVDLGLLAGFDAPTRYLPSAATQRLRQAALPGPALLRERLDSAMAGLPFKQDAFEPFVDAVAASRTLAPLTIADVAGTPTGLRLQPLLYEDASGWKGLLLLSGLVPGPAFRDWWQQRDVGSAQLLDLKQTSTAMIEGFRDSSLERLLLGVAAILLVVAIGLRSLSQALRVLLPVLLSVALSAVLLGGLGERLSLFHLIALLLVTGIGIDYSLFFQRAASQETLRPGIVHALVVCAVSTVTVFGILSLSTIPVLHAIGITVTIAIPLCFLLALAFSRLNTAAVTRTATPAG
jgi:predicted exporter